MKEGGREGRKEERVKREENRLEPPPQYHQQTRRLCE
jgi:hypothetical protein